MTLNSIRNRCPFPKNLQYMIHDYHRNSHFLLGPFIYRKPNFRGPPGLGFTSNFLTFDRVATFEDHGGTRRVWSHPGGSNLRVSWGENLAGIFRGELLVSGRVSGFPKGNFAGLFFEYIYIYTSHGGAIKVRKYVTFLQETKIFWQETNLEQYRSNKKKVVFFKLYLPGIYLLYIGFISFHRQGVLPRDNGG